MKFEAFILLFSVLMLSIVTFALPSYASGNDPYDSGYDHGCDDAGISDSSERYINQPEKGHSFHTNAFMNGYYDGFDACSGSSGGSSNDDRSNLGDDRITSSPQTTSESFTPSQITFFFHLEDIDLLGDSVRIRVTGEQDQANEWRQAIIPGLNQEMTKYPTAGYFSVGENVQACITNFDTGGREDCTSATIDSFGSTDFYLSVPQSSNR
jgi:hypothetical protein